MWFAYVFACNYFPLQICLLWTFFQGTIRKRKTYLFRGMGIELCCEVTIFNLSLPFSALHLEYMRRIVGPSSLKVPRSTTHLERLKHFSAFRESSLIDHFSFRHWDGTLFHFGEKSITVRWFGCLVVCPMACESASLRLHAVKPGVSRIPSKSWAMWSYPKVSISTF